MFNLLFFLIASVLTPISPDTASDVSEIHRIEFAGNYANVLAFHPQQDTVLLTGHADGMLTMQDLLNSTEIRWQGHLDTVTGLVLTPDGDHIISGGLDGCVFVWDAANQRQEREIAGCNRPVTTLALNPSGERLAVGYQEGLVQLYDFATGNHLTSFYIFGDVVAIDFFSEITERFGERLAIAGVSSVWIYSLFDVEQDRIRLAEYFQVSYTEHIADMQAHPAADLFLNDGVMVLSSIMQPQFWTRLGLEPDVFTWEQSEMTYADAIDYSHSGELLAIAGKFTAAGGGCDAVRCAIEIFYTLRRLPDEQTEHNAGDRLNVLDGHTVWFTDVAFSPSDFYLASASEDGLVIIWGVNV